MNLALEALEALGVDKAFVNGWLEELEIALGMILDPQERTAQFAVALAELRDGKVPSIIGTLITGPGGGL
ncbi:MAG: hypothetical protein HC933_16080 [Pleurocapsa sp. SU_196_0]|nr:hypothetical protein [Pleurocapsa sp. SU_196_0]